MDMALAYHYPPWKIEAELTLEWMYRWRVWVEEQPEKGKNG